MSVDVREDTSPAMTDGMDRAVETAIREWIACPNEVDAIRMKHALTAALPLVGVAREDVARALYNFDFTNGNIEFPAWEHESIRETLRERYRARADAVLALHKHTGQPQEGWQLVPKADNELVSKLPMWEAMGDAVEWIELSEFVSRLPEIEQQSGWGVRIPFHVDVPKLYRAMLSAAPASPQRAEGENGPVLKRFLDQTTCDEPECIRTSQCNTVRNQICPNELRDDIRSALSRDPNPAPQAEAAPTAFRRSESDDRYAAALDADQQVPAPQAGCATDETAIWNEAIDAASNVVAIFQSKDVQPILDDLLALKRAANSDGAQAGCAKEGSEAQLQVYRTAVAQAINLLTRAEASETVSASPPLPVAEREWLPAPPLLAEQGEKP